MDDPSFVSPSSRRRPDHAGGDVLHMSCQVTKLMSKTIVDILIMHSQLYENIGIMRLQSVINNEVMYDEK